MFNIISNLELFPNVFPCKKNEVGMYVVIFRYSNFEGSYETNSDFGHVFVEDFLSAL